jgi:hypothetical protein
MIPPLPADVLGDNPAFAEVWKQVTGKLLDGDGASLRSSRERLARWSERELEKRRLTAQKGVRGDGDDSLLGNTTEHQALHEEARDQHVNHNGAEGTEDEGEETQSPDFEDEVRKARVQKMKRAVLWAVLDQVPYTSAHQQSARSTQGAVQSKVPISMSRAEANTALRPSLDLEKTEIPAHLRETISIISTYLKSSSSGRFISAEDEELLAEDIELFTTNIATIAAAVSSQLFDLHSQLMSLTSNMTLLAEESSHSRSSPLGGLLETVQSQLSIVADLRTKRLPNTLATLTATLQNLHGTQRQLLHEQLQYLESSKHGVISRYSASKVEFLATVAQAMALKTRVLVLEKLKETEETTNAQDHRSLIRDRMKSLEQEETQLDQRTKVLREVLEEYEAEGSGLLEKLGARYEEIEKEMQTASKDIERLGRQSARIA